MSKQTFVQQQHLDLTFRFLNCSKQSTEITNVIFPKRKLVLVVIDCFIYGGSSHSIRNKSSGRKKFNPKTFLFHRVEWWTSFSPLFSCWASLLGVYFFSPDSFSLAWCKTIPSWIISVVVVCVCVYVRPSEWKRETGSSGNERGTITQHADSLKLTGDNFNFLVEREREREK